MSSERLWSPQMRKWAKDAHLHGIQIGFERSGRQLERWEGGGAGVAYTTRVTDGGDERIIDTPSARFAFSQPRRIDFPSSTVGPTVPQLPATAQGISGMDIRVGNQTKLEF